MPMPTSRRPRVRASPRPGRVSRKAARVYLDPGGRPVAHGQNLEKSGKTDAALGYYKRIVKDFADTPAAKTAKQRIKANGEALTTPPPAVLMGAGLLTTPNRRDAKPGGYWPPDPQLESERPDLLADPARLRSR